MYLFWILHVSVVLTASCVRIEKNGYKRVTVSFSEGTLGETFDFQKLKGVLKRASEHIFHATRKRSYFEEFVLVIPSTWSETDVCDGSVTEVPKNVDIYITHSPDAPVLATQHSKGCGHKGDIIYLPKEWLGGNTEDLALQFAREWSVFRYGVFSEDPESSGSCVVTSDSKWSPAGCYNVYLEAEVQFEEDGLPLCPFPDDFGKREDLLSSIMFSSNSSKVQNFCDGSEAFPHNPVAPTLHNRICEGNTAWSVVKNSEDFLYGRNLPLQAETPPNIPLFRCFKETKTHLSLAVQDTDSEARTEIRYALFHFLSITEPTDFSVQLVAFSNDSLTEAVSPIELNLQDRDKLKSDLDLYLKLNEKVPNVCLTCGLRKAYEVSTRSQYLKRIILLLARESSLENTVTSDLVEIMQKDSNIVPNFLFLEDTADDIIPSSLVDAVQNFGGRIYRVKNDGTFMLSELNIALLDASKNVLHIEDKILVVHKKAHLNVKSDITDVFLTPNNTEGRLLYSMQCKKRGDIRNVGNTCVDRDKDLQSPICGSETNLSADDSAKMWRHTFKYTGGISEGTTCSSLALLKIESSSKGSFTVKGWLSENRISPGRNALIIYAEIFGSAKQEFRVKARISRPGLDELLLELRDNGNGDPDIIKGDRIYSRYFTSFTQRGTYTVSIYAEALTDSSKAYAEENFEESAKVISQTKIIGTFMVTEPPPTEDIFPPNRVSDLKVVSIDSMNRKILLQWTAPGDDYDHGQASEYKMYFTNDWRNLQETLLNKMPTSSLNASEIIPKINGREEREEFQLPNSSSPTIYYIALKASDRSGNKGKLSNIVQVPIMFERSPFENVTNQTDAGNYMEITHNLEDDGYTTKCYIIIGAIFGIIFLIIVINILVWVICFRKHKRNHEATRMKDVYESNNELSKTGNNINSDENILKSEYEDSYKYEKSDRLTENQDLAGENSGMSNSLMPYAKIVKQGTTQKPMSLNSQNIGGYKIQHATNHKESDLGYV